MSKQQKLGRNDPCWCGSGKKFKRCHIDRDKERPLPPYQHSELFRKIFSKRVCLAHLADGSPCSKVIIKAHTIPKSSLRHIGQDGHLYSFSRNYLEYHDNGGTAVVGRIGIQRASTQSCFCSKHDNELFKIIEDIEFVGSARQCFMFYYRALCHELFVKQGFGEVQNMLKGLDRGRGVYDQHRVQYLAHLFGVGSSKSLNELKNAKKIADGFLRSHSYLDVCSLIIQCDNVPNVMCSTIFFPEYDFGGKKLQDILDLSSRMRSVSVTSFASLGKGFVVFVWIKRDSDIILKFVESMLALDRGSIPDAICRLFVEYSENIYFAPAWWERLGGDVKEYVVEKYNSTISVKNPTGLMDSKFKLACWNIERITNNY